MQEGNILFVENKDVQGVIGKVCMILSEENINIVEYLISRNNSDYFKKATDDSNK